MLNQWWVFVENVDLAGPPHFWFWIHESRCSLFKTWWHTIKTLVKWKNWCISSIFLSFGAYKTDFLGGGNFVRFRLCCDLRRQEGIPYFPTSALRGGEHIRRIATGVNSTGKLQRPLWRTSPINELLFLLSLEFHTNFTMLWIKWINGPTCRTQDFSSAQNGHSVKDSDVNLQKVG